MMYMSAENKEWMAHALFLGEDNMHLFAESRWEWISELESGVFYKAYARFDVKHGGVLPYENDEALNCAIEYAEQKIEACFEEIRRRFNLG